MTYDKSKRLINSDIYNYFGTDREVYGRDVIYRKVYKNFIV